VKTALSLRINGEARDLIVSVHKTLLEVLREDLGLTGTKHGCELGECGTCTVLVDGQPMLSCLLLPVEVQDTEITTIEGTAAAGALHPLQAAFAELGAAQCGYCTPGIVLAAKALLDRNPAPSRPEIASWLAGNLCRCTGYLKILEAVDLAARRLRDGGRGAPAGQPPTETRRDAPASPPHAPAAAPEGAGAVSRGRVR
jgi:aerobic-type carbon monoxide dehydrogenase small subunit (CoxS/CutS family)